MKTIRMIHPFKGLKVGQVVNREQELADWLCSRQYAVPEAAPVVEDVIEPAVGDAFEAPAPVKSTAKKGKK